ncbi:hypothetical protein YPPY61_2102, partial [Yersinia pestis PY-61]
MFVPQPSNKPLSLMLAGLSVKKT